MFSEFSAAARAVITLAEQECRNASHYYLGTEHLLLAMSIAPPPDISEYFDRAGLKPWEVKRALREVMEPPSGHPWEGIIVTPRAQRVFSLAAQAKRSASVQPVDLLQAIIADGDGVAARVLKRLRESPLTRL
jgi:ATP-dependent Clp protease ATP-binding subunit ClpA